jgi:hypothetical protein
VFVPGGARRPGEDTNRAEAQAVVDLVAELTADPDYEAMTFGVITLLGAGQAPLISRLLLDQLGPRLIEERRIRVGDPARFGGDQRDVIIVSMVLTPDPDRGIEPMHGAAEARRVNIAASRATNQLWVVHSVLPESLHADDPRRALLEHCTTPLDDMAAGSPPDRPGSPFERDVLARILDAGYTRVGPGRQVGDYRIDLVVEGPESRLGVQCDGERWHGPDAWDREHDRQMVLDRAGWTFERIFASAFYRDNDLALRPLWRRLDQLGIPKGDWAGHSRIRQLRHEWPRDFPAVARPREEPSLEGDSGRSVLVTGADREFTRIATTRATPDLLADQE